MRPVSYTHLDVYKRQVYINQDSGTTDVESYKPTIATPMTAIKGDEVFEFVDGLRVGRKVLSLSLIHI